MSAHTICRWVTAGLVLHASLAYAAQPPQQPPTPPLLPPADTATSAALPRVIQLRPDTAPAGNLRQPDSARLQELRKQSAFQYVEVKEEEPTSGSSLWSRVWWYILRWLAGLFSGPRYEHGGRYVVYIVLGGALVYVIMRLLHLDLTGLFRRQARALPLSYNTAGEDIHSINFSAAIAEAEALGNYRLAVRLGYLLTLRHLTERGLIQWKPDKTNQDYLRELQATPWANEFRQLTHQFEYVWYGETLLTAIDYPALRETRQAFVHHLTRAAA